MTASPRRLIAIGLSALAAIFVVIFVVGALQPSGGGSTGTTGSTHSNGSATATGSGTAGKGSSLAPEGRPAAATPEVPPQFGGTSGGGVAHRSADSVNSANSANGAAASAPGSVTTAINQVAATRIVRTGDVTLSVKQSEVATTVDRLQAIATALGGYVQTSNTERGEAPSGTATLRIPVVRFGEALSQAEKLGHVVSATTSSRDVTGHYVDLTARTRVLQQTRATYLTILSRADTIGATLAVQSRIDDVQSQIEQLQGQIALLRHQSADATLTVDVTAAGAPVIHRPHHPTGLAAAWHTATHRFTRGVDAIVGALGPLLLAILLAGLAVVAVLGGRRVARRFAR